MPNLTQTVKENPIKSLLGTLGLLIPVVGAMFLLDARYAHAADVEKANNQLQQSIEQSSANLRRQMLEDRLFEIDMKKAQMPKQQLSPIDQAIRDRYNQQLKDLNSKGNNQQH
jgi:C4-dicarboxylate-specific signal transduction histidine kinase